MTEAQRHDTHTYANTVTPIDARTSHTRSQHKMRHAREALQSRFGQRRADYPFRTRQGLVGYTGSVLNGDFAIPATKVHVAPFTPSP